MIRTLMEGLAAGDALGVTSEFDSLAGVRTTYLLNHASGWPFEAIGGGPFGFRALRPTDDADMALAIVKAWSETAAKDESAATYFDGERIAVNFVEWLDSNPPDIGHATRATLKTVRAGTPWHHGGFNYWRNDRHAWSNGSLMRNGVVAGMGDTDHEVFRHTLHHGLITHWAPLPAICCAAQNWLIRNHEEWLREEEGPGDPPPIEQTALLPGWQDRFRRDWDLWICSEDDPVVKEWRDTTWEDHEEAWAEFMAADFNPDSFRPFAPIEHMGFCLTTLQIGVWAMQWASRDCPYPTEFLPEDFPREPFQETGAEVLSWVAMIGRDSDTYGATAGPMIAVVQNLRRDLVETLWAVEEMPAVIPIPQSAFRSSSLGLSNRHAWTQLWEDLRQLRKLIFAEGEGLDNYWALGAIAEPYSMAAVDAGAKVQAVVHVTCEYVVIAEMSYAWEGSHNLCLDPIPFATRRMKDATKEWLVENLAAAEKRRQESYIACCDCGKVYPPEHRFDEICHRCMENDGVKF